MHFVYAGDSRASIWLDCGIQGRYVSNQGGQSLEPSPVLLGNPQAWICVYGVGTAGSRVAVSGGTGKRRDQRERLLLGSGLQDLQPMSK